MSVFLDLSDADRARAAEHRKAAEIQAGQVAATARWLHSVRGFGPVTVASVGPRAGLFSLVAAALEPVAIAGLDQQDAMSSLKEVITGDLTVDQRPEQFCFGLLAEFDTAIPLAALCRGIRRAV